MCAVTLLIGLLLVAVPAARGTNSPTTTTSSSIKAGFNSFDLPSGEVVWFSAVVQLTGTKPTVDSNIHFTGQKLTFVEPDGTTFTKTLYASEVDFQVGATTATTVFSSTAFKWITTVPASYSGDVFLSGYSYYVTSAGLPGGTHVTWSGNFSSSECGLSFNWKWSAAVYTQFAGSQAAPHYANVGVKPVDDNKMSSYQNSDHAGTPENYKADLAQGGTEGGGSNYTGSYSGTSGVKSQSC
ncbi:MAG TPA: hypothetical protein VML53_04930 [Thermoplasmata archaeon]|nr:hypothetical protein [Thermoplasmata archaeon]